MKRKLQEYKSKYPLIFNLVIIILIASTIHVLGAVLSGPNSPTVNAVPRYSNNKTLLNSSVLIDSANNMSGIANVDASGTFTVNLVNTTTFEFEGATADANETTLTVVDPTADRTVSLPNATGTVMLDSVSASLGTDDTYQGLTVAGLNNSGGVTQWDVVYLNSSSAWVLADANGSGTYPAIGLATATASTGNATTVIYSGTVRNDAWAWTIGGNIYVSAAAGSLTQTAPSTTGDKVQVVGVALTADIMLVKPSSDYGTAP